jgi:hypothetical protein
LSYSYPMDRSKILELVANHNLMFPTGDLHLSQIVLFP